MDENSKLLHSVWNNSPEWLSTKKTVYSINEFHKLTTSLFCPGPHYYYIVDFYDRQIIQMSESIESILGLSQHKTTFNDIINAIHPDDISFVAKAEEAAYSYIYDILGNKAILNCKVSYCFRSKVADGSYRLFNHQAVILTVDEDYRYGKSLNIHTDISHITQENNHKIFITRLSDATQIITLDMAQEKADKLLTALFTQRETEIINLITLGFTNEQIAERLFISPHTVRNHRKNILRKAKVKNSTELIARCMKEGLV